MENNKEERRPEESGPPEKPDASETPEMDGLEESGPEEPDAGDPPETDADDGAETNGRGAQPEPNSAEQFVDSARDQAGAAADALRRGEFMQQAAVDDAADADDRLIALLCYVTQILIPLVMPLIVLLSSSSAKRPFQRFHAVQSLALSLTFIVFGLMILIGSTIMAFIPIIGVLVVIAAFCLSPALTLIAFLSLAYYGYQAYQGNRFSIPGLTSFLQDQNWL